jgi:hypothetical protein
LPVWAAWAATSALKIGMPATRATTGPRSGAGSGAQALIAGARRSQDGAASSSTIKAAADGRTGRSYQARPHSLLW